MKPLPPSQARRTAILQLPTMLLSHDRQVVSNAVRRVHHDVHTGSYHWNNIVVIVVSMRDLAYRMTTGCDSKLAIVLSDSLEDYIRRLVHWQLFIRTITESMTGGSQGDTDTGHDSGAGISSRSSHRLVSGNATSERLRAQAPALYRVMNRIRG